jgi:hypothetical protein
MTTKDFNKLQEEFDEQSDRDLTAIVAAGCTVILLAWVALLGHWILL